MFIIHNCQKVKAAQFLTVDQKKCGINSEISFIFKKEGNSDTCYNIDESWRHFAKGNKPGTKGQMPYNSIYMRYLESCEVRFIETESRMVAARGWGEGESRGRGGGEWFFNRYRVLVSQGEKSSGDEWWWCLPNNVNVPHTIKVYT